MINFLAELVVGNEVPITLKYACSDVIHLSRFLLVKPSGNAVHRAVKLTCTAIVSGKRFLILLLLINAATVTMEAEK